MATANIKITIPAFTAPFSPPGPDGTVALANCLPTDMVLESGPATVTVTAPVPATATTPYEFGKIAITGTDPVRLGFTVVDAGGGAYAECGLVFTTGLIDAKGKDAFPDFIVDDDGLLVTDADAFRGNFSFLLLIQNSNFGMGLVDPQISNQTAPKPGPGTGP